MWQQHNFHIIYKITSMDCISAATRHCWYLERNDGYEHCKIHFQIKEVVLLETFLKLRKGTFLSTKFTSLFTISQHRWPHIAVMMTHIALLAERISAKNRKYMPASLFSFSTPPPPHFLPFCSPSQRKPRSVFHSLHELGCDQFIVGREYNCAYFQLLSFPKRSCDTVYLCCGSNKTKQSEYYSHMLWAYFLVRVSRLKCTWPFLKAVMRANWCQNGVFLINRPGELCPLVSWTGILWCEHE